MLRYPDVSRTHIAFSYANDLWLVPREGGVATPLASPPGPEGFARFSPDGQTIAFMGNYDGNLDLYTIPAGGGVPQRATWHPAAEFLCDWSPDGRLLFYSNRDAGLARLTQLFLVDTGGGLPQRLPVPYGAAAALSADGRLLAYTPHTRDQRTWKRYRGGMATDIWIFDLGDHASRRITDWEGTDTLPMWHGRKVYYLSDAGPEHRLNIWMYDTDGGSREQITFFRDHDVKWPSIGAGWDVVFQNGSDLFLLDLRTKVARPVEVTIPGDRPTIRPRSVDVSKHARWWQISPTGKRAVVEARGDIWTAPAEHGSPRNLTRTSGAAERYGSWSPDGRWIAYFSDASGEYELSLIQSDGKGDARQITSGSQTFYSDPVWSPDSKHIAFADKAAQIYLHTIETGQTKVIDKDPWGQQARPSWSHDSRWLAYARTDDDKPMSAIWLHDLESGSNHQVTSGVFNDESPAFDRKGDWLCFTSSRSFNPTYSDVDTTFIYSQSELILALPLRTDVKSPWLPRSDEETWKKEDQQKKDEGDEAKDDEDEPGPAGGEDARPAEGDGSKEKGGDEPPAPAEDDGVSGTWEGSVTLRTPEGAQTVSFVMTLSLGTDGAVTGSISVPMGTAELRGTFDRATGHIEATVTTSDGQEGTLSARITATSISGTVTIPAAGVSAEFTGNRTKGAAAEAAAAETGAAGEAKPREKVEIAIEGIEARALVIPVKAGSFGGLAVNDRNHLIYSRFEPGGTPSIMLFDMTDEKKEEKTVAKGAGNFEISADGKKLLVLREGGASIQDASAGATAKNVVTAGMSATIEPRQEWRQIFVEAWRLQRDYFYVSNLHGVDWPAVRAQYEPMLEDCVTREDVSYVIREMISELNIGHAYYFGGDEEQAPNVPTGLLGADFAQENGSWRIARILRGGPWDADVRSALDQAGLDVKEGDYLLAVNGVGVDPTRDPCAAFAGTPGREVTITVSEKPVADESARDVVVTPLSSDRGLRYRAWIEHNRAYVDRMTDGQVGYVYVPDTGINGQNDLVRQYFGQIDRKALIIDERWNGGGQIPTRFIEMLNRPVTNYWARRDSKDWTWPPDAHHGPKCMLINGLAGSGGDMFPWLFRQAGLGKLIGTRTWGGLVGISGNPQLIDGAVLTVPTFGFYEKDGTWGVEGHGVDPDIEVIDDPALMTEGGDPQLDAAIALMLAEIEKNPYVPPPRPLPPDRSGMGVLQQDR
jgi:tricorn protease-like protein